MGGQQRCVWGGGIIELGCLQQKSLWQRAMRYMNHKPGWWMLYFLYCAIPIAGYVTYLLRRSTEPDAKDGDDNDEQRAVEKVSGARAAVECVVFCWASGYVGYPLAQKPRIRC